MTQPTLEDLRVILLRMEQSLQAFTLRTSAALTRIERNSLVLQIQGIDIMATQAELATALEGLATGLTGATDQLAKAQAEIIAALASSGNTSPAVDAAVAKLTAGINALKAMSQALDDMNPDAPPAGP